VEEEEEEDGGFWVLGEKREAKVKELLGGF
jgi:hypothetical protein